MIATIFPQPGKEKILSMLDSKIRSFNVRIREEAEKQNLQNSEIAAAVKNIKDNENHPLVKALNAIKNLRLSIQSEDKPPYTNTIAKCQEVLPTLKEHRDVIWFIAYIKNLFSILMPKTDSEQIVSDIIEACEKSGYINRVQL